MTFHLLIEKGNNMQKLTNTLYAEMVRHFAIEVIYGRFYVEPKQADLSLKHCLDFNKNIEICKPIVDKFGESIYNHIVVYSGIEVYKTSGLEELSKELNIPYIKLWLFINDLYRQILTLFKEHLYREHVKDTTKNTEENK